jgi:hypothetical protein
VGVIGKGGAGALASSGCLALPRIGCPAPTAARSVTASAPSSASPSRQTKSVTNFNRKYKTIASKKPALKPKPPSKPGKRGC